MNENIIKIEANLKLDLIADSEKDKYFNLLSELYLEEDNEKKSDYYTKECINSSNDYDLLRKCYFRLAPRYFEAFMIAMEWNRTNNARFYLPRSSILEKKHKIITTITDFINNDEKKFLGFSTPPGVGKSTIIKFLLTWIFGKYCQL